MTILEGAVNGPGPNIDKRLESKLFVLATTPIPEAMRKLMSMAFWAVAEQLEEDRLLENLVKVNCFVTNYGDITLKLSDNQLAYVISIINYPIKKWEEQNCGEIHMLMFIIEELCHHYWNIEDEVEVNYKVLEVIKRIVPKTEMGDIYNIDWMEKEKSKKNI